MAYYHDYYNDYDFYDDVFDLYFDDFDNYFKDYSEDQLFNIYLNNCEEDFGHRAEAYRNIKMAERKKNRKRTKAEADQVT